MTQPDTVGARPHKSLSIAVLGPDGSGKSTVLGWIEEALAPAYGADVRKTHKRPARLPKLSAIKRKLGLSKAKRGLDAKPVKGHHPYDLPMPGRFVSFVRLTAFALDYAIDGALRNFGRPRLFLYDRCVDDLLIDPRRYRLNLPQWFLRMMLAPVRRPDVMFLLIGDPVHIASRKSEQTIDEVRRQIGILHDMASRNSRALLLSTDCTMEDTRAALLALLQQVRIR